MREIKFRAWHKKYKYMARVAGINFNKERINLNAADIGSYKDIELMQYTGLKDKNGVEIYEGDMFIDEYDGYIGVIKYSKQFAWFIVEWYVNSHSKEPCDDEPLGHINIHNVEIIGNIYENKELLNE